MDSLSAVQGDHFPQGNGESLERLSRVRPPLLFTCPRRIKQLLDEETFEEWFTDLCPFDPLDFKDRFLYAHRLTLSRTKPMRDAAVVGKGFIRGRPVIFARNRFRLHGGQHGFGGRRKTHPWPRRRRFACSCPSSLSRLRRWRAHARRHPVADADGQGVGGPGALTTRRVGCTSRS